MILYTTYLSVHRSLGNHGPNKLCLGILPHGRSFLRHSVLHFLLLCTSIQPTCISIQARKDGWFAGVVFLYYVEIMLAHYAGILEMNVEKYSLTTPTRLPRPKSMLRQTLMHVSKKKSLKYRLHTSHLVRTRGVVAACQNYGDPLQSR